MKIIAKHNALLRLKNENPGLVFQIEKSREGNLPRSIIAHNRSLKMTCLKPFKENLECNYESCGCRTNSFEWISPLHKLKFYEVPKSASSSVKSAFGIKQSMGDDLTIFLYKALIQNDNDIEIGWRTNLEYRILKMQIKRSVKRINRLLSENESALSLKNRLRPWQRSDWKSMLTGNKSYQDYVSFALVRSPFDRVLSNWRMFTQSVPKKKLFSNTWIYTQRESRENWFKSSFGKIPRDVSLLEFVNNIDEIRNHHWGPQVNYLPLKGEKVDLDFIIQIENINYQWPKFAESYDLPSKMQKINTTQNKDRNQNMNREVKNKILSLYKRDFELLYPELL